MDDLQGRDLRWAYWYNTHQPLVHRIGYGILIGIISIIWLVNLVMLIKVGLNRAATNRAINEIGDTQVNYDSVRPPADLVVTTIDALEHTTETLDIYAVITNPNPTHVGKFDYVISSNGTNYSFTGGVVMPQETATIMVTNLPGGVVSSPDFTITHTEWQRIRGPKVVTNFLVTDLLVNRSNLTPDAVVTNTNTTLQNSNGNDNANTNTNFATPEDATNSEVMPTGAIITQLTGKLTNTSAYGFRRLVVNAVLKNTAGVVVGAQQRIISDMQSFQELDLVFNWQRQFEFNVQPTVTVETNIWDEGNLILPGQN